jgi:hypothetical protein
MVFLPDYVIRQSIPTFRFICRRYKTEKASLQADFFYQIQTKQKGLVQRPNFHNYRNKIFINKKTKLNI